MRRKSFFVIAVFGTVAVFCSSPVFAWTNPLFNPASGGGSVAIEQSSPANVIYIKSNGNVGIGSTNPSADLYVEGSAGQYGMIINGGGLGSLRWGNGAQGALSWDTGKVMIYGLSGNALSLGSNNIYDRLYINTAGNVGIGTTSPTTKLEVTGTVKATGFEGPLSGTISAPNVSSGEFGANTGGGNYSFPANVGIGTTSPELKLDVAGNIHIAGSATPYILLSPSAANKDYTISSNSQGFVIRDVNSATDRLVIDQNTGNVGIGTASPSRTLDIQAAIAAQQIKSTTGTNYASTIYNNTGGDFYVGRNDSVGTGLVTTDGLAYAGVLNAQGTYPLQLATNNAVALTILNGGNVGIGTTTPAQKLSVAGIIESTTGGIKFPDGTTQTTASSGGSTVSAPNVSSGAFGANTGGGNYSFPANVGIGIITPASLLHVNGTADTSLTTHGLLVTGPTDGANISMDQNEIMARNNSANSTLYLNQDGGAIIMNGNNGSGNVGIGVMNPSAKLEVAANSSAAFRVGVSNNAANTAAQIRGSLAVVADNNTSETWNGAVAWNFYNDGTSPSWSGTGLKHYGTAFAGAAYGITASNQGTLVFQNVGAGVVASNGANIYVSPASAVSTTFLTNGNVGIGTTTPAQKLSVAGIIESTTGGIKFPDGTTQITASGIPSGAIIMWSGSLASIPSGWSLCDGTNGTPDLRNRFVYGVSSGENPGATGGSNSHNHTVDIWPSDKTGTILYEGSGVVRTRFYAYGGYNDWYWTSPWNGNSVGKRETTSEVSSLPVYYKLAFIMKL